MPIRQFQAQRMHAPRDFQAIANESVCVEIGAGKGKHALLFSEQHPDKKLIAIERTREKFVAMQKQHQLEGQRNLQIVHADAATGGYAIRVLASDDGQHWQEVGTLTGRDLPGEATKQMVSSDP